MSLSPVFTETGSSVYVKRKCQENFEGHLSTKKVLKQLERQELLHDFFIISKIRIRPFFIKLTFCLEFG